jgi:hypothetical protein
LFYISEPHGKKAGYLASARQIVWRWLTLSLDVVLSLPFYRVILFHFLSVFWAKLYGLVTCHKEKYGQRGRKIRAKREKDTGKKGER